MQSAAQRSHVKVEGASCPPFSCDEAEGSLPNCVCPERQGFWSELQYRNRRSDSLNSMAVCINSVPIKLVYESTKANGKLPMGN
jgi:hypothetical protein